MIGFFSGFFDGSTSRFRHFREEEARDAEVLGVEVSWWGGSWREETKEEGRGEGFSH
jgi:hypothetical protein